MKTKPVNLICDLQITCFQLRWRLSPTLLISLFRTWIRVFIILWCILPLGVLLVFAGQSILVELSIFISFLELHHYLLEIVVGNIVWFRVHILNCRIFIARERKLRSYSIIKFFLLVLSIDWSNIRILNERWFLLFETFTRSFLRLLARIERRNIALFVHLFIFKYF